MRDTRDRIFKAARALFDKEGLDGLSMRRLAGAVGITPMAIYKHFPDKAALMDALMLDGFVSWEARVRAIRKKDPLAWLKAMMEESLDFALTEPHRFEAAFLLPASQARRYPTDFAQGRSPAVSLAYERIAKAKAAGQLDDTPALDMVLSLSALSQGLVTMYRAGRFVSETEFRKAYRRVLRDGFAQYEVSP
ncbi:MAG TPA: TetR/AcrR family transcriptional regulator [Rhizomicrobium sp.]|jgi:AcrR family transcriptional regulator|nr:TetR/AcrR family transcriptional regulator [Rhizomicrobium sp.]